MVEPVAVDANSKGIISALERSGFGTRGARRGAGSKAVRRVGSPEAARVAIVQGSATR